MGVGVSGFQDCRILGLAAQIYLQELPTRDKSCPGMPAAQGAHWWGPALLPDLPRELCLLSLCQQGMPTLLFLV